MYQGRSECFGCLAGWLVFRLLLSPVSCEDGGRMRLVTRTGASRFCESAGVALRQAVPLSLCDQGLTFGQRVGGLGYLSGGDSLRKWYSFRGIGQASSIIVAINAVMLRRSEKDMPT